MVYIKALLFFYNRTVEITHFVIPDDNAGSIKSISYAELEKKSNAIGILFKAMSNQNRSSNEYVYEAEVVDSSVIDEGLLRKVLIRAGRTLAQPALEAFEMVIDPSTPTQARVTMVAALTYLIMPMNLVPDLIPITGFSDDLVALTAVIGLWKSHITPEMRNKARQKLDKWMPL